MKTSSQLIAAATATLWMAPTFAQEQGDPANAGIEIAESVTEFEQDPASVVEWEGLQAPNVLFDESALMTRAMPANAADPYMGPMLGLNKVYVDYIGKLLQVPDGKDSQREVAMKLLCLVIAGGAAWPPVMTGAGGAIGAAAGSAGYGAGAIPLGAAGAGVGAAAGTGAMVCQWLYAVNLGLELNDRYPDVASRSLDMADMANLPLMNEPEEWVVEDLLAELEQLRREAAEAAGGGGGVSVVEARDLNGRRTKTSRKSGRRSRLPRASRYAGKYESLFLHLVADLAGPHITRLARLWDRAPGLTSRQKAALRKASVLRPLVERAAYIATNKRFSSKSKPAMPLATWQKQVIRLLQGDTRALNQLMLEAFAFGNTQLKLTPSSIRWSTPSLLRRLGAPSSFSARVKPASARIKGPGNSSLSATIEPRNLTVDLSSASTKGDTIRVNFKIRRGTPFRAKITGRVGTVRRDFSVSPRIRRDITGTVEFQLSGYGVRLKRVHIGPVSLSLGLKLPPQLKPLEKLAKSLEGRVAKAVSDWVKGQMGMDQIFKDLQKYLPKAMLEILNSAADEFGLASIDSISRLVIKDGRLQASVKGRQWNGLPDLKQAAAKHGNKLRQLGGR